MIFLSLRVTVDAEGGLKGPAQPRRSFGGLVVARRQQASGRYIPRHCLPATAHVYLKPVVIQKLYPVFLLIFQQAQKLLRSPGKHLVFFPYNAKPGLQGGR